MQIYLALFSCGHHELRYTTDLTKPAWNYKRTSSSFKINAARKLQIKKQYFSENQTKTMSSSNISMPILEFRNTDECMENTARKIGEKMLATISSLKFYF